MAVSDDHANTFRYLYDFSKARMRNSSMRRSPRDRTRTYFGRAGRNSYRKSAPFLARMRPGDIAKPEGAASLEYFAAIGPDGKPRFSKSEKEAAPLFQDRMEGSSKPHNCIANLSVAWNGFVQRWVMLYSCANTSHGSTPGIWMRLAEQPWGPWSEPQTIFNAKRDNGLCHFIHRAVGADNPMPCDDLSVPERKGQEGAHTSPSIISRFTTGDEAHGTSTFYYTMSTFNPYTVVIMKASIQTTAK